MRPDIDADRDTRFWRLDTFSDAIFAVAMTLLVFTFPLAGLPQKPRTRGGSKPAAGLVEPV